MRSDNGYMDCFAARTAISAQIDGEHSDDPHGDGRRSAGRQSEAEVELHLSRCADCQQFQADAVQLGRQFRVQLVPAVPDLAPRVRAAITQQRSGARTAGAAAPWAGWTRTRVALLLLGVTQLGLAVPAVLLGGHAAREIGVADLALAAGVLAAAWQPWRAAGMLPVVTCLAAGLVVVAAMDVAAGQASLVGEAVHLLALLDALLLWRLRHRDPLPTAPSTAVPDLRLAEGA